MRSEDLYLADILIAADAVADYARDLSWERVSSERMARSAVIHELQTIGEAVSKISIELKLRHPGIPWAEIVGFRNVVVHEYFGVDPEDGLAHGPARHPPDPWLDCRRPEDRIPGDLRSTLRKRIISERGPRESHVISPTENIALHQEKHLRRV